MSEGNNFDFLMSLQIETGNAVQKINDVWSAMREMASKQVELKLEVNANYQNALRGLEQTKQKLQEVSKSAEQVKKEAEDIGQTFEIALRKAQGVSKAAAKDIQEAFNTGNIEKMEQALAALQKRSQQVGAGHLKEWLNTNGSNISKMMQAAPTAAQTPANELMLMRKLQGDVVKAAGELAATRQGSVAQKAAKTKLDEANIVLEETGKSLGLQATALAQIFNTLADLDQEIAAIEAVAARATKNHDTGRAKEIGFTLDIAKQYRAQIETLMSGDVSGVGRAMSEINSAVKMALEGKLTLVMEEVSQAIRGALSAKLKLPKGDENMGALRAEAMSAYQTAHLEVLNLMEKAAFEALGPALAKWGPRLSAKLRGAYGDVAGGGAGVGADFAGLAGKVAGMMGGGGAGRVGMDGLVASVAAIINQGNADKIWPNLQLYAHEPTLHDSVYTAIQKFNEKNPELALKAKLKFELPATGFVLPLNKSDLASQIASAFDEAGKLIRLSGIQVGYGTTRKARAAAGGGSKAETSDADSDLSQEQLWAKYGASRVRPTRRQTEAERAHNDAVRQHEVADRNQLRARANQNPMDLIREFGGGNPALLRMAESIKSAKDFTPKTAEEVKLKLDKIKEAETLLGTFFQQLYEEAKNLAGAGNTRGSSGLNYAGREFKAQVGTSVRSLAADKEEQASRRAIREAEAAADARQAYSDSRKLFDRGIYEDVKGAPLDRYRDRMEAYRRLYELVRNYEREITAYTHARNEEEILAANKRINSSMRELEIQRDILNSRLLAGTRGSVGVRRTEAEWRVDSSGSIYAESKFVTGQNGQFIRDQVSLKEAYARTATVLNETLRPALEHLNVTMRAMQREALVQGRTAEMAGDVGTAKAHYARAQGMQQMDFPGMLSAIQQGSGAGFENITDAMAKTMRLSAAEQAEYDKILVAEDGIAKAEKFRNDLAQQHLRSLMEEVAIYKGQLLPVVERQRSEIALLDRYDNVKRNQEQDPHGLKRAARGLSNTFGFYAGGMMVGFMAQSAFREAINYQKELAEIQGVLANKSPSDAKKIGDAITTMAMRYGASIGETAQAAKTLAQTGLNATEVASELNATLLGMRGLGITIQQMQELQIAIHSVQEEMNNSNATFITSAALVEKMSHVESQYAVSAQNLADALKISAPFVKTFAEGMRGKTDFVDVTSGITTVMVEQLRVSGTQAGNALKTTLSRLLRPEILAKLQGNFGLKLGTTRGEMLPLDEVFGEVAGRYKAMKAAGGPQSIKADQMLAQLAGAHRVNYIAAVLNNYDQALKVAEESANSFGEAQMRADMVMDTFGAKVTQARNAFQLFANDLLQNSLVADGLKGSLEGVAVVLGGLAGSLHGYGSGLASVIGITGGTLAVKGIARGANRLGIARTAYQMGVGYGDLSTAIDNRRRAEFADRYSVGRSPVSLFGAAAAAEGNISKVGKGASMLGSAFGKLVNFIGPTGVILLGLTAFLGILGGIHRMLNGANDDARKYGIRVKSDFESGVYDSPQYKALDESLKNLGYTNIRKGIADVSGAMNAKDVQGIPQKYGAANYIELLGKSRRGELKNAPEIANDVIKMIANSNYITEDAKRKIRGISDEGERLAYVTKLIGEMAFAATWQITQALAMAHDSIGRQVSDTMTGMQQLDAGRERTTRYAKVIGALGDMIMNRAVLNRPVDFSGVNGEGNIDPSIIKPGAVHSVRAFFEQSKMPVGQVNALFNAGSIHGAAGFFQQAIEQAVDAFMKAGKTAATTGELISQAFQILDDKKTQYTIEDYKVDQKGGFFRGAHAGSAHEYIVDSMAKEALKVTSFQKELQVIDPRLYGNAGKPSDELAMSQITQMLNEVEARANELLQGVARSSGTVVKAFDTEAIAEFVRQQRHMAIAVQTGAQYITVFKDKLLDLVLSLYTEMKKLDSEDAFAARHGKAFNRAEKTRAMAQQFFEQFDTFDASMAAEYTKKAQELKNTQVHGLVFNPGGDVVGPDGKVIDVNAPDDSNAPLTENKATARRMQTLRGELLQMGEMFNQMMGGLYNLAQSMPNNPISRNILNYMSQNLPKDANGIPVGGLDAVSGLRNSTERLYTDSDREVLARRLRILNSSQRVKGAENTADVGRMALDVEEDMTKKTEGRLEVARQLLQARIEDLNYQVQQRELDADAAQYQLEDLKGQLLLSTEMERQTQLQQAKNDLTKQGLANLKEGVESLTGSIGNLDLFGQMFRTRGLDRRDAIRKYTENIFKSVADPLAKRMSENLNAALVDYLKDFDGLMNVAKSPEHKMKGDIVEAGDLVGGVWRNSIVSAGSEVAAMLAAAMKGQAPSSTPTGQDYVGGIGAGMDSGASIVLGAGAIGAGVLMGGPRVGTTPDNSPRNKMALVPESFIKSVVSKGKGGFWDKYNKNAPTTAGQQIIAGLGSYGGQLLGTGLGGGGSVAQAGSSVGAMAGSIAGQAFIPIPGLGAAVGGLVGGALGGLLGGKLDGRPPIDREINHLEAIEFNTRETISAIEQQTDKLRKPDASLFNLPSGFNIPGYSPQFAGGGGGGGISLARGAVQVNVGGGSNMSSSQIQQAVEKGVTEALNKGRTGTPRSNSKY
jgi:hypothetical protein